MQNFYRFMLAVGCTACLTSIFLLYFDWRESRHRPSAFRLLLTLCLLYLSALCAFLLWYTWN